jgi:hypothetical protein
MLFKKIVYYDSLTRKPVDSITTIMIEGVSGDNKSGRKQSIGIFKFLRKQLRSFYRSRDDEPFQAATLFSKGINRSFPDCLLYQGHSDELKFYFVIILYAFPPGREISFKLPGYN